MSDSATPQNQAQWLPRAVRADELRGGLGIGAHLGHATPADGGLHEQDPRTRPVVAGHAAGERDPALRLVEVPVGERARGRNERQQRVARQLSGAEAAEPGGDGGSVAPRDARQRAFPQEARGLLDVAGGDGVADRALQIAARPYQLLARRWSSASRPGSRR